MTNRRWRVDYSKAHEAYVFTEENIILKYDPPTYSIGHHTHWFETYDGAVEFVKSMLGEWECFDFSINEE